MHFSFCDFYTRLSLRNTPVFLSREPPKQYFVSGNPLLALFVHFSSALVPQRQQTIFRHLCRYFNKKRPHSEVFFYIIISNNVRTSGMVSAEDRCDTIAIPDASLVSQPCDSGITTLFNPSGIARTQVAHNATP